MISRLDHVNILTAQIDRMVEFYTGALGLEAGWRPDFSTGGAWLYCDGKPIIHLVDRPDTKGMAEGRLEHCALTGSDKDRLLASLEERSVKFDVVDIPGTDAQSVNFADPDDNHIEVIFGDVTAGKKA